MGKNSFLIWSLSHKICPLPVLCPGLCQRLNVYNALTGFFCDESEKKKKPQGVFSSNGESIGQVSMLGAGIYRS